jgi:hypothetical protein
VIVVVTRDAIAMCSSIPILCTLLRTDCLCHRCIKPELLEWGVAALPVLLQAVAQLPRDKPPYSSLIDKWLEQLCVAAGLLPVPLLQQQQQQHQSSATAHSKLRLASHTRAQLALSFTATATVSTAATAVNSTVDSPHASNAPAAATVLIGQQLAVLRKRHLQRLLARGFLRCSSDTSSNFSSSSSSSSSSATNLLLQQAQLDYVKRLHNGQRELKTDGMVRPPTVPLAASLDEVVLQLTQLYAAVKQAVSTDAQQQQQQQQGACLLAREAVRACTAMLSAHLPRSYAALAARPLSTLSSNSSSNSSGGSATTAATSNAARYGYKPKAAATSSAAATAAAAAVAVPDDGSAALRVVDLGGRCAAVGHFTNAVALLLAAALFSALAHGERSSELQQQLQQCEQQLLAACSSNSSSASTAVTGATGTALANSSSSIVIEAELISSIEDFVLLLNSCTVSSFVHARDKLKDILAQRADLQ